MPVYSNMFVALGAWRNVGDLMDREPERNTDRFGDLMDRWDALEKAINDNLPSGSGFDSGCEIVSQSDTKVVIDAPYHHMNAHGYYDGWVTYRVAFTPTFTGPDITVKVRGYDATARKYADDHMRDYVAETLLEAVTCAVCV